MITIHPATTDDLSELARLFDLYRIFYKQPSSVPDARRFLETRLSKGDSVILLARRGAVTVGFTQLYPSFSSVSLQKIFILNDLYVMESERTSGAGGLLLEAAKAHCIAQMAKGLALETATDNPAQHLYERMGWVRDSHCFHYFWTAPELTGRLP